MSASSPRGAPVIYVAGSARELPAEVQDWLGRADIRAVASPHIYDMLAQLAQGRKFAAIIINIRSVDWNEMDFFDHVARLSRLTPLFVTGSHQHRAKLEAACRNGARLFDAGAIDDELAHPTGCMSEAASTPSARLGQAANATLAAPLERHSTIDDDRAAPPQASWPRFKLTEPLEPLGVDAEDLETACFEDELPITAEIDGSLGEVEDFEPVVPAIPMSGFAGGPGLHDPSTREPASLAEPTAEPDTCDAADSADAADSEDAAIEPDPAELEPPPSPAVATAGPDPSDVRPALQEQQDPQDQWSRQETQAPQHDQDHQDAQEPPVVFPWTVHPNRPKRVPPAAAVSPTEASNPDATPPAPSAESPFRSVRLTPEEINALMGQPRRRQAPEGQA